MSSTYLASLANAPKLNLYCLIHHLMFLTIRYPHSTNLPWSFRFVTADISLWFFVGWQQWLFGSQHGAWKLGGFNFTLLIGKHLRKLFFLCLGTVDAHNLCLVSNQLIYLLFIADVSITKDTFYHIVHNINICRHTRSANSGPLLHLKSIIFSDSVGTAKTPLLEEGNYILVRIDRASLKFDLLWLTFICEWKLIVVIVVLDQTSGTYVIVFLKIIEHVIFVIHLIASVVWASEYLNDFVARFIAFLTNYLITSLANSFRPVVTVVSVITFAKGHAALVASLGQRDLSALFVVHLCYYKLSISKLSNIWEQLTQKYQCNISCS